MAERQAGAGGVHERGALAQGADRRDRMAYRRAPACPPPGRPVHPTCMFCSASSKRSKRWSSLSPNSVTGSPRARSRRTTSSLGSEAGGVGAAAARESGRAGSPARLAGREPSESPSCCRRRASCSGSRATAARVSARRQATSSSTGRSERCRHWPYTSARFVSGSDEPARVNTALPHQAVELAGPRLCCRSCRRRRQRHSVCTPAVASP